jgi:heme/copper-type cytochrome/quinol oxidase subunit 2
MLFSVRAVSPAQYQAWVQGEIANGHTIKRTPEPAANTPPPYDHVTQSNALAAPDSKKGSL